MRWISKENADSDKVITLAQSLGVSRSIAQLLIQRGINDFDAAKDFFRPHWNQLHDPFLMRDMDRAIDRILEALEEESPIMVYGDYDVDGTTSVALVASFLKTLSPNISTYIPDRYAEGYGVSYRGIDRAAEENIPLIIALDCGVKAIEQVRYAKEKGVDFIICDHHRPGDLLPDAIAVLDPKRADCEYPYDELCGCGIGFKLIQAIAIKLELDSSELYAYLDLVATAIGADIVPITGENRTLASLGIEKINTHPRPGFKALIKNLKKDLLNITDLVFIIAPRINAAGRMDHGNRAVELLMEPDEQKAMLLAEAIEQHNLDRRSVEQKITEEALDLVISEKEEERESTVVYRENWHKGVIGIVASRLIETYYRPTLVFTKSGEVLAASARSVSGFDIYQAIESCEAHLIQFGGHKYAAGVTLKPEKYELFKQTFEETVSRTLDPSLKERSISVDAELGLDEITPKFYRILKQFAPFGPGNMSPNFVARGVQDTGYAKTVGQDGAHLKGKFCFNDAHAIDFIGFKLGDKLPLVQSRKKVDIVFSIDENEWNGKISLQLKVKDIKVNGE
jgi:single-stranded-DNA-specific exonuclease